jgi:hypothetical protein
MSHMRESAAVILVLVASLLMAPIVSAQVTPSVTVSDQAIENGTVTVDSVVSDGPGWIVIHAQENGAPGPVIGHAAVSDGENTDVVAEIDVSQATETLYAMLHTDSGQQGIYEFPDGDPPVQVDGQVVVQPFMITGGLRPSVTVMDQAIEDSTVVVPGVISDGPGWIVIHADQDGAPGPVIGHSVVSDGVNTDVSVEIDVNAATETLYAMLHTDSGQIGTYEFPGGDPPVQVEGNIVVKPFTITGGLPAAQEATPTPTPAEEATATPTPAGEGEAVLPETGAPMTPSLGLVLLVGALLAIAAGILISRLREPAEDRVDK